MANGDIRQMLNMMQMFHISNKHMNLADASKLTSKEESIGLFDVLPQLFNKEKFSKLSDAEKIQLYFADPSMIPLFVQDNYIKARPFNATTQRTQKRQQLVHMELLSSAADSISDGDLFESSIRTQQQWSLMPLHGVLSTVRPAFFMQGTLTGRQNFPAWLGKFSSTKKNYRQLEDIRNHMQSKISATASEVCLQYLPLLKGPLSKPLLSGNPQSGIATVIECMDEYGLSREDWNSIFDICHFSSFSNPILAIPSSTKSKFTREFNKSHKAISSSKGRAAKEKIEPLIPENEEVEPEDDSEEQPETQSD
eukprot:CAMPEP_0117047022 /NCGR_PEP_ID=MMETSP0472-20121206/32505_1 /TAXON_ID=693140 ORGANISM="Tiarina fusus, Strain LIS" /NCGR_SAMPLE_ID=MMETSP0472 /ASSEMBLY_ACC=CAM_ASM_000603 /LENGTH=308 /DNA_ID=CAMNT_0004759581 /DNA_START=7 /DNA_END=930 /DNA_ORIENTATION=-